ncbi:ankyrin repeat domain-containing protein 65 [Plakobranchus ocellatus]|uniref:Ankyrin repeat domain-containing protein 65 n=1 Tax=Plakobranchus ocellatus TaxID=259542 RepID=A0AAV4DWJ5_9GAST|nr:ankyrin repeat domain-containing protein 65 [Plakobranchus ocellatus]
MPLLPSPDNYLKKILEDGREDILEQLVLDGFDGLDNVDKEGLPEITKAALDRFASLKETIASTMKTVISKDKDSEAEVQEAVDAQPLLARAKDEAGRSLLHRAVLAGASGLVEHLATKFQETLKMRDNCNRTPLHYAWGTSSELAELLISKGASTKARDAMKKKPVYYKNNKSDIKAILVSLGLGSFVPEVTIGEIEQGQMKQEEGQQQGTTSAEPTADTTAEEQEHHLATVMGADVSTEESQEDQTEKDAA